MFSESDITIVYSGIFAIPILIAITISGYRRMKEKKSTRIRMKEEARKMLDEGRIQDQGMYEQVTKALANIPNDLEANDLLQKYGHYFGLDMGVWSFRVSDPFTDHGRTDT